MELAPALPAAGCPEATRLRAIIVAEARSFKGTPFVRQGGVRGVGIDCVQLILHVYRAAGVLPADFTDGLPYPRGWAREGVNSRYRDELCVPYFRELTPEQPALPGDLCLYWTGAAEAHTAIVTAWPLVVHAYPGEQGEQGEVVETAADRNVLAGLRLTSRWRPKALA